MTNQKIQTDVAVIGAGPGGYAAAFRAADLGKQVVMIDKNPELGGVCLNRGCIPSKALLHIAKVIREAQALSKMGVVFDTPTLDLVQIRTWKTKVVNQLNRGIAQLVKVREVQVVTGRAQFISANELFVDTNQGKIGITFENVIIATGSRSTSLSEVPVDHSSIMKATEALQLGSVPERLLVIGGGYIGLEMGSVYQTLGSEVSVVEVMDSLLPGTDFDLVKPLHRRLKKQFESIMVNTKVFRIEPTNEGSLTVNFESGERQSKSNYRKILVTVGRQPNSNRLGLEKAGIEVNDHGFIVVDKFRRTNVSHIYAVGDVAGEPMLAHKATHEGKVAAEVIAGLPAAFDTQAIPAVIFTDPEIAWVGLTETDAKAKGITYEKGEFPWAASGRSLTMGRNEGKTKILFDPDTERVLGVGIVGPGAGDLISEGVLAIEMGAKVKDIRMTMHPHPTLSETISNAAEVFAGTVTDLFVPVKKQ